MCVPGRRPVTMAIGAMAMPAPTPALRRVAAMAYGAVISMQVRTVLKPAMMAMKATGMAV